MKQNGTIEAITVAGMPAGSLQLATVSPILGRDAGTRLARRRRGGKAISFVFVARSADFDQLKPTFDRMLSSIDF